MKLIYIILLYLCPFLTAYTSIAEIRRKEALSLGARYQYLAGLSQRKPIIRINPGIFRDYVKATPRNYSMIIMFTAMAPQRQCMICRVASEEFQIVANSLRYSQVSSNKLFFGVVDFDDGSEVFNHMRLNTAPAFIHFPAKGKPKPSDTLDIQRVGFGAESIAKWIADRTDVQIRVFRPPNYAGAVAFFMIFIVVCGFLYIRRNTLDFSKFYNKNLWGTFALIFTLAMISGQMWNHIRSPPFVHKTQNGGIAYIHGSSQAQFIFETYIIIVLDGMMVLGMILMTDAAQKKGDVTKRRTLAIIGLFLFVLFFSLILVIFRTKAHAGRKTCPYCLFSYLFAVPPPDKIKEKTKYSQTPTSTIIIRLQELAGQHNWAGWLEAAAEMHNREMHATNGNIDSLRSVQSDCNRLKRMGQGKMVLWDAPVLHATPGSTEEELTQLWATQQVKSMGCREAGMVEEVPTSIGSLSTPVDYVEVRHEEEGMDDSEESSSSSEETGNSATNKSKRPNNADKMVKGSAIIEGNGIDGDILELNADEDNIEDTSSKGRGGRRRSPPSERQGTTKTAASKTEKTVDVWYTWDDRLMKEDIRVAYQRTTKHKLPTTWFGVGTESRVSHGSIKTSEQCERLLSAGNSCDPPVPGVINTSRNPFLFGQASNMTQTAALVSRVALGPARDYRLMALKCILYDELVEDRFIDPTGVDWAFSSREMPCTIIQRMNHGETNNFRCVFVGDDIIEIAVRNNGVIPVGDAAGSWSIFDHNTLVIGLPDYDPTNTNGLYVWILTHLKFPLYERSDLHEVFSESIGKRRIYRFVRNACLVDIHNKAIRIVFVRTTKSRERLELAGGNYDVFHTDYHYTIPEGAMADVHDLYPILDMIVNHLQVRQINCRRAFDSFTSNFLVPGVNWLEIETIATTLITRYHPKIEATRLGDQIGVRGLPATEIKRLGLIPVEEGNELNDLGASLAVNVIDNRPVRRKIARQFPILRLGFWGNDVEIGVVCGLLIYDTELAEDRGAIKNRLKCGGLDRLVRSAGCRLAFEEWKRAQGLADQVAFPPDNVTSRNLWNDLMISNAWDSDATIHGFSFVSYT